MHATLSSLVFASLLGFALSSPLLKAAAANRQTMPDRAAPAVSSPFGEGPQIQISVTASVDPDPLPEDYDFCGPSNQIQATLGQNVRWCYEVTNTGSVSLSRHTLSTTRFGNVLVDFPYTLVPGGAAFLTQVDTPSESGSETATWAAFNPGPIDVVTAQDSADVEVRAIELAVTVSIDPVPLPEDYDFCGSSDTVIAEPGDSLRWCYTVSNIGSLPLQRHTLVSADGASILQDFSFSLVGGASAFITRVETMGNDHRIETGIWTAFNPGPVQVFTASDSAFAFGEPIFFSDFE